MLFRSLKLGPLIRPQVEAYATLDTAIWFLQLRWVAVSGQLLTMAVVLWGMRIELPIGGLLTLIGITAATNLLYWIWLARLRRFGLQRDDRLPTELVLSTLMLVDISVLTGMLYLSAGIANPFALFYFVNIAVAGAIVTPVWAVAVWLTSVAGVTLLLSRSLPIEVLSNDSLQSATVGTQPIWTIPKLGFLVAFATCSGVITYFIAVLTGELRRREQAIQEAEIARARNRQLEGLATLAAGAAHELASPLSTIAVVAKELSRALDKHNAPASSQQDVQLIRSELDQCRQILDRMTSAAGDAAGERLRSITLSDFLCEAKLGLRQPYQIEQSLTDADAASLNVLPVQAAAQALRNLLQNAVDASEPGQAVRIVAQLQGDEWVIAVIDHGHGMEADVLERIVEPFFTTKEPGRGMGLGLYLTENVIRRLDGSLEFDTQPQLGTTATMRLPTRRD